ncbi:MAG: chromosome segregation protein SMC [Marine Group III euryarchaeote CG-Bathy1]|uniref:Chromosome segregation protein SMC n=1 Tax=Marine Group III euryarchaeote CG-Bathy1 TaxID=1889001 RepID=A0A1J5T6I8_9ARCH|nr:MAG: chromosome segregation protein SMC [Marine Group III euryarchaeote CG-Bathy1]
MRLLELEFENFKSFKGHVTVPLGPGFTCITGPNGSGKSNITDAILFILGSRSTKLLRARKLKQLIYGFQEGSKKKTGPKACKVSMVFDNRDRFLAIEKDQVTFTKGIRLRGNDTVTYYQLDGVKSSAGEFGALFSRAGLYATGYNIIQQGDVIQTSLMSGIERRRKIEDVAGITAYDNRLKSTRSARNSVEADLTLLNERAKEAKRTLNQLEREKEDAEKLEKIIEEIKENELLLRFRTVLDLEAEIESRRDVVEKYTGELVKLEKEQEKRSTEIKENQKQFEDVENTIAVSGGDKARELQEELDKTRVAHALAERNAEKAREELELLESGRKVLNEDYKESSKDLKGLTQDLDKATKKVKKLESQVSAKVTRLSELEGAAANNSEAVTTQRDELESLRKDAGELEMQKHRLEGEKEQLEIQLTSAEEQIVRSKQWLESVKTDAKEADFQLKDLEVGNESAAKNLDNIKTKHNDVLRTIESHQKRLSELEAKLRNDSMQLASQEAAQRAREEFGGYTKGVKALLQCRDERKLRGIIGTIAELGRVDEKYATALEIAAGARLQSIVTEDDEAAATAIEFLKRNNIGRVRFLPLNKVHSYKPSAHALLVSKKEGALGFAQDLVKFDSRYKDVFGNVFGDTVIMKTLGKAREYLGTSRMVTLEGELLESGGALVGGSAPRIGIHFGTSERDNIDELSNNIRKIETEKLQLSSQLGELLEEAGQLATVRQDLESERAAFQTRVTDYDGRAGEVKKRLDEADDAVKIREGVMEALQGEIIERTGLLETLEKDIEKVAKLIGKSTQNLQAVAGGKTSKVISELQISLDEIREEFSTEQASLASLTAKVDAIKTEVGRLKGELELNQNEQKELQETRKTETSNTKTLEKKLKALRKEEQVKFKELKGLRDQRDELHDLLTDLRTELASKQELRISRKHAMDDLKVEIATREPKLVEAQSRIPEGTKKPQAVPSREKLESGKEILDRNRNRLGNVNMLSLEHYRLEADRFDEIKKHRKQLNEEVRRLDNLEKKISEKKESKFMGVYNSIGESFKTSFKEITGGGEAWLVLENEKSPFEGGVTIKARMPRKKLYPVEALSGGEKSLVSMAFIFAIQGYDPSPFYLLDEPDQNLDGVNTEHIGRAIALQSQFAQFLVVSLHHAALRESDNVIGVFMGDDGVSRLHQIRDVDTFLSSLPVEAEVGA